MSKSCHCHQSASLLSGCSWESIFQKWTYIFPKFWLHHNQFRAAHRVFQRKVWPCQIAEWGRYSESKYTYLLFSKWKLNAVLMDTTGWTLLADKVTLEMETVRDISDDCTVTTLLIPGYITLMAYLHSKSKNLPQATDFQLIYLLLEFSAFYRDCSSLFFSFCISSFLLSFLRSPNESLIGCQKLWCISQTWTL